MEELKRELLKQQEVLSIQNRYISCQIKEVERLIIEERKTKIPKELQDEIEEIENKIKKEKERYAVLHNSIASLKNDAEVMSAQIGLLTGQRNKIQEKINRLIFF
jgi:septal ring factor EnvC (AmiA/AmiB activator)